MHNHTFDQCMRRIQKGDRTGLKEIYEDYISYIYAIIIGIVKNRENAEDLTTDFFIRLWNTADSYKPGGGHKTWMTAIARNMAIDFMRKSQKEQLTENIGEDGDGLAAGQKLVQGSAESDAVSRMSFRETIAGLAETERQIVTMKIAGQMTFKEIAKLLNMPIGTVTWKYQNSMEKLRRAGV